MTLKRFTPPKRPSGNRDARLIIIAAEGTNTEKKYFDDLVDAYTAPNIHLEVLDRIDAGSDPKTVLKALDDFQRQ